MGGRFAPESVDELDRNMHLHNAFRSGRYDMVYRCFNLNDFATARRNLGFNNLQAPQRTIYAIPACEAFFIPYLYVVSHPMVVRDGFAFRRYPHKLYIWGAIGHEPIHVAHQVVVVLFQLYDDPLAKGAYGVYERRPGISYRNIASCDAESSPRAELPP